MGHNPFESILKGLAELAEELGQSHIAIVLYCLLGTIKLGNSHELAKICQNFIRGEIERHNN